MMTAGAQFGQPCRTSRDCQTWNGLHCEGMVTYNESTDAIEREYVCRCRPSHPVQIHQHLCERSKKLGEECINDDQCAYEDINSQCLHVIGFIHRCGCQQHHAVSNVTKKCFRQVAYGKCGNFC